MATKIDYKKVLKQLYDSPKQGLHIVDVPQMNFLMLDGEGDLNQSPEYQQAIEALYTLSYGIKFMCKLLGHDYVVPSLEGLWWIEGMPEFNFTAKDQWNWTMMIIQPDWVTSGQVEEARKKAVKKKRNPSLPLIRYKDYHEGLSVQTVYTGAYADEAPSIAEIHQYIRSQGFSTNGRHHEIYLADPHKVSPERLKTVLRQPIVKI